jgi:hypothetical protein
MHKNKVTLEKVFRGEQETKFGMRNKVGIKIREQDIILEDGSPANVSDKYITALFKPEVSNGTEEWEEGMQVEITASEKGGYFNFKPVGHGIEDRLKKLEDVVFGQKSVVESTNEINPDEINF